MANNIVTATFNASHFAVTPSIYRYNYGNILVFEGIENLPEYFEVHFANRGDKTTTPWLGQDGQVKIPNDYLQTGKQIVAYIYLHETAADGETVYKVLIPVRDREEPEDVQPTPEQQTALEAAIYALNTETGVATEAAAAAEESAQRAEEAAASIDEGMIAEAVADYLDEHPITVDETDPTVPEWAKQPTKPSYTASEVGAVPAEAGKGLSTNDYTTAEKQKLAGIEAGADKTPDLSHYVTDSDYDPDSKTSDQTQPVGVDANGKLWTAPGGSSVIVDDELSDTSENPVQNKIITGEVRDLKTAVTKQGEIIDEISTPITEELVGTVTNGKFINYNAAVVDAVRSYYINTYSAASGDEFFVSGTAGNGGYCFIFTDANGNTIDKGEKNTSGALKSYESVYAIAPNGTVNLIVSSNITTGYAQAKVDKITGYSVNGMQALTARMDSLEDILVDVTETVNTPSTDWILHDNHYMFTGGDESGESSGWCYYEYQIPEIAKGLIVTANAGQSARLWILKDANNSVVGFSSDSSAASIKTETVALSDFPTATKLFVNDKKSGKVEIKYTYTAKKVDGDNVYFNGATIPDLINANKLWGKTLCCCGDSITYGADMDSDGITDESNITVYNCDSNGNFSQTLSAFLKTWGWQIASRNNMTFYNGGVSGSTMQGEGGINGFSLANGRYTKLPDSIDYLLIWFGWNDNAYGTLGEISDTTNASYYGGYNVVLPYLINKYPFAKIGLIVPFGSSAGHREAVRLLGNKWGVAVWDNYQGGTPLYFGKETSVGVEESVVTANRAKFQANGAHPNYKGHKQLADMIEDWLKTI